MARLTSKKADNLKQKVKELHDKGQTNKQIANELHTTEKTVSKWLKPYIQSYTELQEIQTKLIQRINKALSDKETTPKDLACLFQSLRVCKNVQIL